MTAPATNDAGDDETTTMTTIKNDCVALAGSFLVGAAVSAALLAWKSSKSAKNRQNAGATVEGDDLSLFYGDVSELTTITKSHKFLPKEIYASLVRDSVVVCVDILLVRTTKDSNNEKQCLLVERGSEPVKGVWWLPGGRLLKGETFFAAAIRKAKEETGLANVTPIQVLGVWNTFFQTSHWDTETQKGTQTVNAIVLVELETPGADVILDDTSERSKWIALDAKDAKKKGEDKYVVAALERLHAWNPNYST